MEVGPKATADEIKKSFRKLAHEYHPDKNPENVFAEAKFRAIHEAYTILNNEEKRALYETGKRLLSELGYIEIGMDHFALKTDSMYKAMENKTLHRNFMGYTAGKTQLMIGLGMSAISDSWYSFAQNVKSVEEYSEIVNSGEIPLLKGHLLSEEDLVIRKHILNIMCNFETSWENDSMKFSELENTLSSLKEMEDDGLVEIFDTGLKLKEEAIPFVRNVCMAFDLRLKRNQPKTRIFSMTI